MGCCVPEIVGTVDAGVLRGRLFLHFLDKVIEIAKYRVLLSFCPNILKNIKVVNPNKAGLFEGSFHSVHLHLSAGGWASYQIFKKGGLDIV